MKNENTAREDGFTQVAIWPGTTLGDSPVKDFIEFFAGEGFRIQYLEEINTAPDMEDGKPVKGTGGRTDQVFAVHEDDIAKFSVWRLPMGMRWIEDAMSATNGYPDNPIYPDRFDEYQTWNADGE